MKIITHGAALTLAALVLAGCDDWRVPAPPHTSAGQHNPSVPDSTVRVPVQIRTAALTAAIMDTYRDKPLSEGRSPEISAKLLIDEGTMVDKLVDILVSPARPVECVIRQVPREITRRIKVGTEAYGCALSPWRWGNCWRDVFRDVVETITEPVRECTPEIAAVWKKQLQPVLEIHERVFPTSIWVNHDLSLTGLKMVATGNRINIVGDLKLEIGIDLRQGALGASMTVKGALKCDSELTLRLDADLHVTPDAALDVKISDADLAWRRACAPGAVEAFDVASFLNPTLLLSSKAVGDLVNNVLRKELNRAIQEGAADDLNFRDDLIRATPKILEAHAIGESLWLEIGPSKIVVSDIRGGGDGAANALTIDAGFVGRPRITVGPKPKPAAVDRLPFELSEGTAGIALAIEGSVPLAAAQERVAVALRKAVDDRFANQPYITGGVELYQSGDRIVVGIEIRKRSSGSKLGSVYLWTRPQLSDDRRAIRLMDVGFDVESRNILAKTGAWMLDGMIEKIIAEQAIPIGGALDKLLQQNNMFSADINIGLLRGEVTAIEPGAIWVGGEALRVLVLARGDARIDLKAPRLN